jgi:hypothetical protein
MFWQGQACWNENGIHIALGANWIWQKPFKNHILNEKMDDRVLANSFNPTVPANYPMLSIILLTFQSIDTGPYLMIGRIWIPHRTTHTRLHTGPNHTIKKPKPWVTDERPPEGVRFTLWCFLAYTNSMLGLTRYTEDTKKPNHKKA